MVNKPIIILAQNPSPTSIKAQNPTPTFTKGRVADERVTGFTFNLLFGRRSRRSVKRFRQPRASLSTIEEEILTLKENYKFCTVQTLS